MSSLQEVKLFTTQPHTCSYLPEQEAQTIFIDPEYPITAEFHTRLSEIGFRRSGNHIYRPHCANCQRCIASRVLVNEFQFGRRFRRILKSNADISVTAVDNIDVDEYYQLYENYINSRHQDGDMYPASREQFRSFLVLSSCDSTRYYSMRLEGKLVGLIVTDALSNSLSAVYTYYATDEHMNKRSLGSFAILWQIQQARELGMDYLYLGYWIKDCDKMNYKIQYRPQELLIKQRWVKLS